MKDEAEMAAPPKMKNGARVLLRQRLDDDTWLVMCQWNGKEFVTWYVSSYGNAYCGHYFSCPKLATADFDSRLKRRNENGG